jgi:hypothetical protein
VNLDDVFKTRTLAGILANQGQLKKAEEIILHLLKQNPHQPDLEIELDLLRLRMNLKNSNPRERLNDLYKIWIHWVRVVHRKEDLVS